MKSLKKVDAVFYFIFRDCQGKKQNCFSASKKKSKYRVSTYFCSNGRLTELIRQISSYFGVRNFEQKGRTLCVFVLFILFSGRPIEKKLKNI